MLPAKPIGVPGASSPSQMAKPAHRALFNASPGAGASSPLQRGAASSSSSSSAAASSPASKASLRKRTESEFDVGDDLSGYGLQGVKVTEDDLLALVEELGLGGEEAGELVKGLSDFTDKAGKGGGGGGGGGPVSGVRTDGGDSEQPAAESEAEAMPGAVVPAREEVKAADGDGVKEAETEVADAAST